MDILNLLKIFNWCFILTGNGSIKLIQKTWMLRSYVWRFAYVSTILVSVYHGNKWVATSHKSILEPTSILLIARLEFMLFGPLISIVWRLYFEDALSNVLNNFMITLNELKKFKSDVRLKTTMFWICIVGVILHFIAHATVLLGTLINVADFNLISWVTVSYRFVYDRFMFYEYMSLVTLIQIIVYKLNDEISKGIIPFSELTSMYTSTLDSLDAINRFIVGAPVLIDIILNNVSTIINELYYSVFFRNVFVTNKGNPFYTRLHLCIRFFEIVILYYLCQTTEKEIRRTTLILNKRSITGNPALRRKIAIFSLQTLHADFHFEMCGFFKIDIQHFLTLLFNSAVFLSIQIQLNISTIYEAFKQKQ